MKRATILLLDLTPDDSRCNQIITILKTSSALAIKFEARHLSGGGAERLNDFVKSAIRVEPQLVICCFSDHDTELTSATVRTLATKAPTVPVVLLADGCEPASLLDLLKCGASDYVTFPLKPIDIVPRINRLLERATESDLLVGSLKERLGLKRLIGESAAFLGEVKKFPVVAKCDATVLLVGETGTGKELCARAIHYLSPRSAKPFVPVNCGAIPADLVENELFGHEREAFTGAATSRMGLVQEADGGTLFLDEIDCLPLLAQVKLLRFLQEKEYRPLGAARMRRADIRIMAASNADLEAAVKNGTLRRDLYYRLSVIPLMLPPLRDRREDIPLLARHFLAKYADELNKRLTGFTVELMQSLVSYEWPGNVRELEHLIQRAAVMCQQEMIDSRDMNLPNAESAPESTFQEAKAGVIARFERNYLAGLLRMYGGNISKAARSVRKDPRALRRLIRKYNIDVRSFRQSA